MIFNDKRTKIFELFCEKNTKFQGFFEKIKDKLPAEIIQACKEKDVIDETINGTHYRLGKLISPYYTYPAKEDGRVEFEIESEYDYMFSIEAITCSEEELKSMEIGTEDEILPLGGLSVEQSFEEIIEFVFFLKKVDEDKYELTMEEINFGELRTNSTLATFTAAEFLEKIKVNTNK